MKTIRVDNDGFTLIEVMVTLGVFSIGFIAFLLMATTSIKGGATAGRVSNASNWVSYRLEQALWLDYDNVSDNDNNGVGGFNLLGAAADATWNSPDNQYVISLNVAEDIPGDSMKTLRVIVQNRLLNTDLKFTTIKIANK